MRGNARHYNPQTRIAVLCFMTALASAAGFNGDCERYWVALLGECFGTSS